MHTRIVLVTSLALIVAACGGGGGGSSPALSPAPPPTPAPTATPAPAPTPAPPPAYTLTSALTATSALEGPSQAFTTDSAAMTLAPSSGGTLSGQGTSTTAGIQSLSINVTNVAGVTFSETFLASDIATSTPISGQAPRALLSGSKTASDGSVRSLTILDVASGGFNYMLLGLWEYASAAVATSTSGQAFVVGSATRPSEIPVTGTASYSGVMVGRYADGAALWTATASASATADFANRSVAFSTANTQIANQAVTQAAPTLNLSGTLTYPAATNNLAGTLSTTGGLTGPSAARFYGPAAVEVGGVFFVKDAANTKQMTGFFGLKQ